MTQTCCLGRPCNSGFILGPLFGDLVYAFYFTSLTSLCTHTAHYFVHSLTVSAVTYCSASLQPWEFTCPKSFQGTVGKTNFIAFQFCSVIFLHTSVESYTFFYPVVHNSSLFSSILAVVPYHIYLLTFMTDRSAPAAH